MAFMATQREKDLAYEAGQAALSEPPERRTVEACPFAEGTEERAEWLAGFDDALEDQSDLRKKIKAARANV
jgi:ribosome modulation factor